MQLRRPKSPLEAPGATMTTMGSSICLWQILVEIGTHNNGDGTFTRVTEGSLVNDAGNSVGCAWGDYDNDGFLDLFVANGAFGGGRDEHGTPLSNRTPSPVCARFASIAPANTLALRLS